MKIKDLTVDTAIIAPPATPTALTWAGIHVPDVGAVLDWNGAAKR